MVFSRCCFIFQSQHAKSNPFNYLCQFFKHVLTWNHVHHVVHCQHKVNNFFKIFVTSYTHIDQDPVIFHMKIITFCHSKCWTTHKCTPLDRDKNALYYHRVFAFKLWHKITNILNTTYICHMSYSRLSFHIEFHVAIITFFVALNVEPNDTLHWWA